MPPLIDLTGRTFGRLVVLRQAGRDKWGMVRWLCRCDPNRGGCGNTKPILAGSLKYKGISSCGCARREATAQRNRSRRKHAPRLKLPPKPQDTGRTSEVVRLRGEGKTFAAIGRALGITRQRAHQLWRAAQ
jgi:DNA-binding CsgD family transcriptional regulator